MLEKMAALRTATRSEEGEAAAPPLVGASFRRPAGKSASMLQLTGGRSLLAEQTLQDVRDIEPCESMLEVYFMQTDNLVSRLAIAKDKVTDTEDLISLDLDHRRNELVALNLVVNCIMLMFALVSAVTGAFGMNFNTWMAIMDVETSRRSFMAAILTSSAGSFILFITILSYARFKRLLFIVTPPGTPAAAG